MTTESALSIPPFSYGFIISRDDFHIQIPTCADWEKSDTMLSWMLPIAEGVICWVVYKLGVDPELIRICQNIPATSRNCVVALPIMQRE